MHHHARHVRAASAARGEQIAALHHAHARALERRVAGRAHADPHTIEDACAFAWAQLLAYQPKREHIFAWLRTTALREAWLLAAHERLEVPEAGGPTTTHDRRLEGGGADPEQALAVRELLAELAALSPRRRRILALQTAGYSYAEIEAITGDGPRAIDRQLRRARNQLERRGAKTPRRRA